MMTPTELRRDEEEKRIAAPLNDAWKRGFEEGKKQQTAEAVRAFAEWYRKHWSEYNWEDGPPPAAEAYLASLAAKGEER